MKKRGVLELRTGQKSDRPSGLRAVIAGLAPRIAPLGRSLMKLLDARIAELEERHAKKTEGESAHGQRSTKLN